MLCYSYLRFSSTEQAKGDSKRRQLEASQAYATKRGWQLDDSLRLADLGVSAFKGANAVTGALGAFLRSIKAGRVQSGSALIIESVDRLSRDNIMEAQEVVRDILRAGLTIITLQPEREYTWQLCNENPFLLMELMLYQVRANEESATKSKRVIESWDAKRRNLSKKPASAVCPKWIKMVGGKFELIPERAAIVQRIFQMCLAGQGAVVITKTLNKEGVPPFARCALWHQVYINHLLRGRQVLGEYQPRTKAKKGEKADARGRKNIGQAIVDYYPRAISDEVWYQAQAAMSARDRVKGRKGRTVTNLFTALMFDARDGSKLYLRDGGHFKSLTSLCTLRGKTTPLTIPYELFEAAFLNFIQELKLDSAKTDNTATKIQEEEGIIADQTKRIERYKKEIEQQADFDAMIDLLQRAEASKKAAQERLERVRAEAVRDPGADLIDTQTLLAQIEQVGPEEMEAFRERVRNKIRQLVSEIWFLMETNGSRYHRRATIQIFFKEGGWRFIRIDHDNHKAPSKKYTNIVSGTGEELGIDLDLRQWRFA